MGPWSPQYMHGNDTRSSPGSTPHAGKLDGRRAMVDGGLLLVVGTWWLRRAMAAFQAIRCFRPRAGLLIWFSSAAGRTGAGGQLKFLWYNFGALTRISYCRFHSGQVCSNSASTKAGHSRPLERGAMAGLGLASGGAYTGEGYPRRRHRLRPAGDQTAGRAMALGIEDGTTISSFPLYSLHFVTSRQGHCGGSSFPGRSGQNDGDLGW